MTLGEHTQFLPHAQLQSPESGCVFYATIADADIGSLKSLHTLFDKYLDQMLVKFEQNCMVRNIQNFELFDKNG